MLEDKQDTEYQHNGEVLVFLHYFGGSKASWNWVIEKLSKNFRCIALNLPGFGDSEPLAKPSLKNFADYVQSELEVLGIDSYTIIGHSMGGKIATQIAIDAPNGAVKQLILVAPSPPTTEPLSEEERKHMLNHPNLQEAERSVDRAIKKPLSKEQYDLAVKTQFISEETTWRWWILDGMNHSIAEKASVLQIPITVLASNDDPVITATVVKERIMPVFKNAKLVTTQGVGHLSPMEDAEWIANQILNVVH